MVDLWKEMLLAYVVSRFSLSLREELTEIRILRHTLLYSEKRFDCTLMNMNVFLKCIWQKIFMLQFLLILTFLYTYTDVFSNINTDFDDTSKKYVIKMWLCYTVETDRIFIIWHSIEHLSFSHYYRHIKMIERKRDAKDAYIKGLRCKLLPWIFITFT